MDTNKLSWLKGVIQQHWQPKPINPPKPETDVEALTGAQRSAEVIRYSILSLEFWLSPLGKLREWVRLNGKVCAMLLIPALLILPLITFILGQIAHWLALLVQIFGNLIILPLAAFLTIAAITVLRAIFGR